jgi:uncharacterized membrane protein
MKSSSSLFHNAVLWTLAVLSGVSVLVAYPFALTAPLPDRLVGVTIFAVLPLVSLIGVVISLVSFLRFRRWTAVVAFAICAGALVFFYYAVFTGSV